MLKTGGIGGSTHVTTWINVTTGHTRADLVDLAGTVVLNYDITGPADRLESTAIAVYITDSGNNGTAGAAGEIDLVTSGNNKAGVVDLDDGTIFLKSPDISPVDTFSSHVASNSSQ